MSEDSDNEWVGDIDNAGAPEGNTNAQKTGFYVKTNHLPREVQDKLLSRAESYMEEITEEKEYQWHYGDKLREQTKFDCMLLAVTEWRIAQAEGIMLQEVEEYLEMSVPEQNLEKLINRRQNLRKDLGLLSESPEQKAADASQGFFDALSGDTEDVEEVPSEVEN